MPEFKGIDWSEKVEHSKEPLDDYSYECLVYGYDTLGLRYSGIGLFVGEELVEVNEVEEA